MALFISLPRFGRNKQVRCTLLWKLILAFYKAKKVEDRLKALSSNRFDHAPAFLKAGAAQIRRLVPFFHDMAENWHLNECTEEMLVVKQAMSALNACYSALSMSGPSAEELKASSILFAGNLATLNGLNANRWAFPPKAHLFLELCAEPSRPSSHWNYREEDFGGSLARMVARKGGHDTPLATSQKAIRSFCLKHPPPRLVVEQ